MPAHLRKTSHPTHAARVSSSESARVACTLEATAPKAGNVYPGNSFSDLCFDDFLASAQVCAGVLAGAADHSIGELVIRCVRDSARVTQSNANLGIVLLLAPLARAAALSEPERDPVQLQKQLALQLDSLSGQDGQHVYEAIRLATAGGLGSVEELDVNCELDVDLMAAMRAAADRDKIAEQFTTNFSMVFDTVTPILKAAIELECDALRGITRAQIELLSRYPDTLIARKCGLEIAQLATNRAASIEFSDRGNAKSDGWKQLDNWLRADGNRRNPGTTADLIAAGLFVLIFTSQNPSWIAL